MVEGFGGTACGLMKKEDDLLCPPLLYYLMRDGGRIWGDRLWINKERKPIFGAHPSLLSDEGWWKDLGGQIVD